MLRISGLRAICLAGAVLSTAGCAHDASLRNNPNFQQGYDDGCAAASAMGANPRESPYRNEDLYNTDEPYRAGWGSGFSTCRNGTSNSQPYTPLSNPTPVQH